jgi:CRP-like cAMP-binding protein
MSENLLLAALPKEERQRLDPFLKPVELKMEEVLIMPNEPITQILFPYDAVTSTIQELHDGSSVETGLMGIEGVIGLQLWLRSRTTPTRTLVQVPGRAHRMDADNFIREVMNKPASPLNELIARYTHAFLTLTSQTAACNRMHTLEERLCRWLMMTRDRVRRNEFPMRQEFLAMMLGVHRPTVSTAASVLQKAGFISYNRGQMTILDPQGLKAGACECYDIMNVQFDKIFNRPWREFAHEEDEQSPDFGAQ